MASRHKPPISAWIASERKAHGWKVEELSARLRGMGYEAETATVRVWEAGRSPKAETIEGLERLFESKAPRDDAPDNSDLVAAIRELVEEVRLSRLASERSGEVLAELLGVVAAGRLPRSESASASAAPDRPGVGR